LIFEDQIDDTMRHQNCKSKKMQSGQRLWQPFVVARQATELRDPAETALDYPAAREQHEAFWGVCEISWGLWYIQSL
jgi:hypothetical protein